MNSTLFTVNAAHNQLSVPVCCKLRVFEDIDKSVRYAKMLERAGAQVGFILSSNMIPCHWSLNCYVI